MADWALLPISPSHLDGCGTFKGSNHHQVNNHQTNQPHSFLARTLTGHPTCLTIQTSNSLMEVNSGPPTLSHQDVDGTVACRPRSTSWHVRVTKNSTNWGLVQQEGSVFNWNLIRKKDTVRGDWVGWKSRLWVKDTSKKRCLQKASLKVWKDGKRRLCWRFEAGLEGKKCRLCAMGKEWRLVTSQIEPKLITKASRSQWISVRWYRGS